MGLPGEGIISPFGELNRSIFLKYCTLEHAISVTNP